MAFHVSQSSLKNSLLLISPKVHQHCCSFWNLWLHMFHSQIIFLSEDQKQNNWIHYIWRIHIWRGRYGKEGKCCLFLVVLESVSGWDIRCPHDNWLWWRFPAGIWVSVQSQCCGLWCAPQRVNEAWRNTNQSPGAQSIYQLCDQTSSCPWVPQCEHFYDWMIHFRQ